MTVLTFKSTKCGCCGKLMATCIGNALWLCFSCGDRTRVKKNDGKKDSAEPPKSRVA